ncbi:magnesium/cobalt transporter CorA [Lutimonas sp.]|uniref:magnesium/cobalt transporter CorA n=1 Tax=Lutimonas sp. TaxID=1872403 RepID=UPI003D9AFFE4
MTRFLKTTKHEIGLSPQELLFRGQKKEDEIQLRIINFDESKVDEKAIKTAQQLNKYISDESVTWVNIDGLHDIHLIEEIGNTLDLSELLLADVLETNARPKIQDHGNWIFISLKLVQYDEINSHFTVENLSLIFNETVVVSFQEKRGNVFDPVRDRIRNHKRTLRSSKTDYLVFALLDTVIDHYLYVLSLFGEKIESFEEVLIDKPDKTVIEKINLFKKELNHIRKGIKPAKEVILSLSKTESEFIESKNDLHFKELVNNINLAADTLDNYRELLSDQLNIYHMIISSKLNDIMKFLTIFSVIFIPLTFIAGVYGTNFDFIPELHMQYGYFLMLLVMLIISGLMLYYFKRKKWL